MTNTEKQCSRLDGTEMYCFNCHYWRITVPNFGGIVDKGVCGIYCDEKFEDDTCGRWKQATEDDKVVLMFCRNMINKYTDIHSKELKEWCQKKYKEDMRKRVLKIFDLGEGD